MTDSSSWQEFVAAHRDSIDQRLDEVLRASEPEPPAIRRLQEAMRYSVLGGGKRLRPLTVLAAASAVGADPARAVDPGCALELIHCYSLVHDDLPGMDDDELRRGRPTLHKAFDEATAILAGDGLLTAAFSMLADVPRAGALVAELARAAGHLGMVGGQAMDIAMEGSAADPDQVLDMYERKTGALIGAACAMGAIVGGAPVPRIEALRSFGRAVGKLFQVADDLIGLSGNPSATGKPVGRDQQRGKATLIAMLDERQARARAEELLAGALARLEELPRSASVLAGMARFAWERSI